VDPSAAEYAAQLARLEAEERVVSSRRRRLHDKIDFLRAGGGVASDSSEEYLRKLQEEERELSIRRRELHAQIDALRVHLGRPPGPPARERQLGG
jgi:predicted  nucleic acid-binding Zn-ribbon protein